MNVTPNEIHGTTCPSCGIFTPDVFANNPEQAQMRRAATDMYEALKKVQFLFQNDFLSDNKKGEPSNLIDSSLAKAERGMDEECTTRIVNKAMDDAEANYLRNAAHIEFVMTFLKDRGHGSRSEGITWMELQDKYDIPAGEFSLVEELEIALKATQ